MLTELLLNAYPMTALESVQRLTVPSQKSTDKTGTAKSSQTTENPAATVQISDEARALQKGKSSEKDTQSQSELTELKKTDQEVRQHEAAHLAAAGGYAKGGASFEYTTGPDNKRYAVGGEVNIDTSEEKTPEATLQKARQIRGAALAPASPSGQDRAVAASAAKMEAEAKQEIAQEKTEALPATKIPDAYSKSGRLAAPSSLYLWTA